MASWTWANYRIYVHMWREWSPGEGDVTKREKCQNPAVLFIVPSNLFFVMGQVRSDMSFNLADSTKKALLICILSTVVGIQTPYLSAEQHIQSQKKPKKLKAWFWHCVSAHGSDLTKGEKFSKGVCLNLLNWCRISFKENYLGTVNCADWIQNQI